MQYCPGKLNCLADMLSRQPMSDDVGISCDEVEVSIDIDSVFGSMQSLISIEEIKAATAADAYLSKLVQYVKQSWPTEMEDEPYLQVKDELSLCNGCVCRLQCVIFPTALRDRLINLAHEGHPGITRTLHRIRETAWWPGMTTQVRAVVTSCTVCVVNNENNTSRAAPLIPVNWPEKVWSKIAVDIVGELHGLPQRYAITVMDYNSRWPKVRLVNNVTSETVIEFLLGVIFKVGTARGIGQWPSVRFNRVRDISQVVWHSLHQDVSESRHDERDVGAISSFSQVCCYTCVTIRTRDTSKSHT
jgi:hypothetical protein